MNHRIKMLSVVFLTSVLAFAGGAAALVVGKSIATVNGEAIYLSEFENNWKALQEQHKKLVPEEEMTPEWIAEQKKLLLDQMIEEKLLTQEAKKRGIKVPKRRLEEGIQEVKSRFKNFPPGSKPSKEDMERELTPKEKAEFTAELKEQDLTEKQFNEKIEDQLRVMLLTEDEIRGHVPSPVKEGVGEKEPMQLTPEYEKETKEIFSKLEKKFNIKDFKPNPDDDIDQMVELLKSKLGETVHARHIFVKSARTDDFKKRMEANNKIKSIKKELDAGADFMELAKKYNEGPSAKEGGDLGFFTRGQMVPEFDAVAFELPVGGISDVVETQFGFHILMVEEKKAGRRLRYDDIKADLAGYVYQKKSRERYEEFIGDLRKKADIKVLYNLEEIRKG